jgi:uncharacterized repeat protein (TIGR01451 family)
MRTFIKKSLATATIALLAYSNSMLAQTMIGSVITQPCNNNGNLSVTVSGLTPPITYTYTNWIANQSIVHSNINSATDNLLGIGAYQSQWTNANVWQVFASDGINSCFGNFTLTAPFIFNDSLIVANCPASSSLQASFFGGTSPYSCIWTNQNTLQTYSTNPAAVSNGQYSVVVIDGAGCMVSSSTGSNNLYAYSNSGITATITGTSANCTNGTASITAIGGVTPYTYLWNNGSTNQNLSGLTLGSYSCLVTDAIGCQETSSYYLPQSVYINYNTSITNATCLQANGSILGFVSGGTSPYSYMWSNGATTQNISGLTGNQQYIVQITDANGCIGNGYATVFANSPISITYITMPSSCTLPTGSASLTPTGGAAPYNILWYTLPTNTIGNSISNKASGTYSFQVTDANGCVKTGSIFIPPVSTINAALSNGAVVCPAIAGTLTATAFGSNPPFTYAWSNSATTNSIGVPLGSYSCVITDALGCSVTKGTSVYQTSPLNVGFTSSQASCIYNADGSLTANATGGTSPYSYTWSNAQNGPTTSGLLNGYYYVYVTDANGCTNDYQQNSQAFVGYNAANNSCYCTITGTVFTDSNNNCFQNTGETGINNVQIHCSGLGYTYTNANGVYSFMAPSGSYTLTESVQQTYPLAACQSNAQVLSVTAGVNCISTLNFANNITPISDLHIITTSINQPVPGNPYYQQIIVQNEGTINENTLQLGYTSDGQLSYNSCVPWALTQQNSGTYPNWYSITSGFPSLAAGANSAAIINYNVPINIPINTTVNFFDSIASVTPIATSWLTDNTPWNNIENHQTTVVGSYDPNFKEVTPKGVGPQGNITVTDSVLTYVVHFQNTGSYYAQNIVVVDTIDSNLKLSSLRPGYSNHAYTVSMSENGVVKFIYKNVNLPWKSAFGDVLSSGMFSYSIKLKNNLTVGTKIKNKAAIYFDYNDPIITNSTLNTIAAKPVSINENKLLADNVLIFPNPTNNYFTMLISSTQNTRGVLSIFDISGREVSVKNVELQLGENKLTENTSILQSGIYFVQLKTGEEKISKKLIVTK